MDLSVWITYFIATIVLSVTPGPGVFSSISSGLHHGLRLGIWNAVGMQIASLIWISIVALGLGAILLASEEAFAVVKWAGVAYLVYIGVMTWHAPPRPFVEDADDTTHTPREIFARGFLVNMTNPKGIIFIAAILPQFIDAARPLALQYVILAATTFVVDLVIMMGYTALAAKVFAVMRDERHLRIVNRTLGGAFITAGIALAGFRRAGVSAA